MVTVLTAEAEFNRQQGKYIERFCTRVNAASGNETLDVLATGVSSEIS